MNPALFAQSGPPLDGVPLATVSPDPGTPWLVRRLRAANNWERMRRASMAGAACPPMRSTQKSASQWQRLADVVTELHAWPEMYINLQWTSGALKSNSNTLWPNQLACEAAINKFKDYTETAPNSFRVRLESSLAGLARMVGEWKLSGRQASSDLEIMLWVLSAERSTLPPLFRLCMLHRFGADNLCDAIRDSALVEYVAGKPVYDSVWGAVLPWHIEADADRLIKERVECLDPM